MKRILSLLTCIVLVAACVVVPVSAASDLDEGKLLNLLDYGNAIESETNYMRFTGETSLTYAPPFTGQISYVDVVFRYWSTASATLDDVILLRDGEEIGNLKIGKIRGQYYRVFGTVTNRAYNSNVPVGLKFVVSNSNQYSYVSIESFNIGSFATTAEVTDARLEVTYDGMTVTKDHSPSSRAVYSWTVDDEDPSDFGISLYAYYNWQKFDYIDYTLGIATREITSITVTSNGSIVPFEVSEVYSSENISDTMYMITVRVDQTNVDRSLVGNYPEVAIWGNSFWSEENVVTVSSVVGHIKYAADNPIIYWFKKTYSSMVDGFQNVVDAIVGGSPELDAAGDNMQGAANGLNNMGNAFDQVATPDIDAGALTGDFTNFNPSGLTVLATITSNSYVTSMLVLVFTFALCAYIFFGRKR